MAKCRLNRLRRTLLKTCFWAALWGTFPLAARSWSDLDEGEHEIYGREREEKLPIRFFFVQKEDWENHYAFHFFFLWATKDYPRYRSGRAFPIYYRLESKIDNRYLLLTPLYYQEVDGQERDEAALWLYYWGSRAATRKRYTGLFPVFYYSTYNADSPFLLTPLFWYSRRAPESGKKFTQGSSLSIGVPVIPLIIWDSSPAEWDLILFYLMRHRARGDDTLSHILPLYYYHRKAADRFYFISPLYYAAIAPKDRDRSLLWIFYWGSSDMPVRNYHALFPLYYYAGSGGDTTLVSPLWWTFSGKQSHFELLLPVYLSYRKGDYALHVNAAGISFAEDKPGTLPLGVAVRGEKIFLDSDFGWFYNLFRLSSRKRIAGKNEQPLTTNPEPEKPKVTNRRARNRDDSESFFGVYSFFGVFAYERADHYRHFRLLPLSWLTWDANNDTGVQTLLPFYVRYKDEASEYFVLGAVLPFYGSQQKFYRGCTGKISAWFVILYWDEFDCETQISEKTVLWPVINHYHSPAKGGYRIFPVFWKKWWREGDGEKQMHFSPLHYTRIEGENFSTISWLFYRNRDEHDAAFGIWGIFHRSRAHDGSESALYIIPVYYSSGEYEMPGTLTPTGAPAKRSETLFTFAGVFWRFSDKRESGDDFTMHLSPLYLFFGEHNRAYLYSWFYYRTQTPGHDSSGVPLLFHRRSDKNGFYSNFYLFPFYYSREQIGSGERPFQETVAWLFPVFYRRSTPQDSTMFLLGYYQARGEDHAQDNFLLLAGRSTNKAARGFSWHAGLYTIWYERENKERNFRLGYGLLFNYSESEYLFSWHLALVTGYKYHKDGSYNRHHLLPLWWHAQRGTDTSFYIPILLSAFWNEDNGNRLFRAVLLGTLYYHNSNEAAYEQTEHALLGILYYHNKYPERRFDSYGSLWGGLWHYETEANYKRFSLGMFIYIRTETENGVRHRVLGIPL